MDKCVRCGAEVREGVRFCSDCMRNDCKDCTKRYPGCHAQCESGIRAAEVAAIRRRIQHEESRNEYTAQAVKRTVIGIKMKHKMRGGD